MIAVVDHLGVDLRQPGRVVAALPGKLQFLLRAQVGPHGVVELKIAAAGVVERLHDVFVGLPEVREECVEVRIDVFRDALAAAAEVQHRRRRNGHLGRDLGVLLHELEMLDEGMRLVVHLAGDAHAARLGLDAGELDAVVRRVALDPAEAFEKIEMPPGAAVLAVGRQLQTDLLLLGDDLLDLGVFDRLELRRGDLAFLALGARVLQRRGTQDAAHVVGAKRRLGTCHRCHVLMLGRLPIIQDFLSGNVGTCKQPFIRPTGNDSLTRQKSSAGGGD